MNNNLIAQLESFKKFIDTINNTTVQSKTDLHRQFYLNNPELSKRSSSKTEMIRNIGKDFVILSNDNVLLIQEDLEKILQHSKIDFDEGMVRKVINIIHNVIISSNLSENNGKDIYVICIREIDKYVTVHTGYKGKQVTGQGILCEDKEGKEYLVPGTTVICALGQRSRTDMVEELRDAAPYVAVIGDAAKVSTITNAVYWGYHGALDI